MLSGSVTLHLSPALADNLAYLAQLRQDLPTVAVRTDAVVSDIKATSLTLANGVARISLSVNALSDWGEINPAVLRIAYRKNLTDEPTMLTPAVTEISPDGTVSLEVEVPQGQSGFLQPVYAK